MISIQGLIKGLKKHWPDTLCEVNHHNPLELMIGVILAAQSTDKTVNEITPALFKRFPSAKAFAESNPLEVEKLIYRTGFFRAKSKSVRNACKMIVEKFGGKVPKTMEELLELPGIGRKSANVVLGAGYGITAGIVVDTHMIRLTNERLKLTKEVDPVKIERDLMEIVPKKEWIYFSQSMVLHGRYICIARKPRCFECHLVKICPYPDKNFEPPKNPDDLPRRTITGIPILIRKND